MIFAGERGRRWLDIRRSPAVMTNGRESPAEFSKGMP